MLLSHMPLQSTSIPVHSCVDDHMSSMSFATMQTTSATYSNASLPSFPPASSNRPKLSLNTRSLPPSFGQRATSLRLETLSTTSPTTRNTFKNATAQLGQTSSRPSLTPISIDANQNTNSRPAETADSSPSTAFSASIADPSASLMPSTLPDSVKSTMSNSPMPRAKTMKSSSTNSRSMFPAAKRVLFRSPLTEEIKTSRFTMRHSDISSSNSSISTLELSPPQDYHASKPANVQSRIEMPEPKNAESSSPRTGDKRDSSDEEDDESCPATPVAGRQKRHRQWVWTLPPVSISSQETTTSASSGKDTEKARNES